ncbi:cAMP-regulated phosphoprotein 21 [Acipenser ruthenus]|uniref:cAMP-regulated phosphoprotein 21 n=1 Tax=Acipenser ruthenus TaxID=7906 RepID=A0A662YWL9_ACIRT|nr:cAMP-regulated phosphoprotein 21 [Acipenser ruthenus]
MSEQDKLNQEAVEEAVSCEQENEAYPHSPDRCVIETGSLEVEENESERQKEETVQSDKAELQQSGAKGKLVRSLAVCEESSLPPTTDGAEDNQDSFQLQITSSASFQVDDKPSKDEGDREQEKDKNKEKDKSNEKPKIRMLSKVRCLFSSSNHYKKFPQMSSYHRMLVHRVAAYFGMDHNVDQTGKSVIINKTSNTRIPEERFCEHIKDDKSEESQKRFILKRDNSSIDKEDNQQNRIHPFRDDRRSKSIEEREEEYQRVRERIFAQDSVCSQENLYVETRILEDCIFNDTQKKRQLFKGNRDGMGKSGSRQSSTETDVKWKDQRPWSSTDSDSSNRNLKPAVTKTASIGGITVLTRGDSSASSRSTGKLSKTGSESSSSGGSSGSLSRVHQSLQSTSLLMSAPVSSAGSVSYPDGSGLSGQVPPNSPSYILVPLEATGIPPGSILLNPHTGQPFVNPDGTPAIYNPPSVHQSMRSQLLGQSQQQNAPASQQQPPQQQPQQSQQQIGSHMVSQRDDMASQFGQMSLSRQSSGEAPEPPPSGSVYPPPLLPQPPQQPGYIMASPSQQIPPGGFTGSGPPMSQQVLQPPQGYVQQPPAQMPVYYYPSGQYPTSASQQYRPVAPVQYNAQRNQQIPQASQQTGYQTVLPNQQGFQGLMGMQQPPQNQSLMSSQQGNQVQGMLVQYPAMSSYQVGSLSLLLCSQSKRVSINQYSLTHFRENAVLLKVSISLVYVAEVNVAFHSVDIILTFSSTYRTYYMLLMDFTRISKYFYNKFTALS